MTRPETVFGRRQFVRTTSALMAEVYPCERELHFEGLASSTDALAHELRMTGFTLSRDERATIRNAMQVLQGALDLDTFERGAA